MTNSSESNERVIHEFKRRQSRLVRINLIGGGLIGATCVLFGEGTNFGNVFIPNYYSLALWAGVGMALSFFVLMWILGTSICCFLLKCPACERYPGMYTGRFCSRCGVILQEKRYNKKEVFSDK